MFGNNSNVFGQLNQNLNKPAFNFGSTQPTQQQQQSSTFVFGATSQNEVKHEANKLNSFNFGSQPTANFNYLNNNNIETLSSPPKTTTMPSSLSNSQQTPFAFTGFSSLPVNLQSVNDVSNLQQILTPQTRLMKKPNRRIKKWFLLSDLF